MVLELLNATQTVRFSLYFLNFKGSTSLTMVLEALNDSKTILELIYAATQKEKTETISKSAKNGHICMFV